MKTKQTRPSSLLTVLSLALGAVGLNIGASPQAGDTFPAISTTLFGLGLFVLAIWLWTKRRGGIDREDVSQLMVALALIFALVGVSFTSVGTGAGNMMQNDGYSVTGGIMALLGGLTIGAYFGARFGFLQAKNKEGKK